MFTAIFRASSRETDHAKGVGTQPHDYHPSLMSPQKIEAPCQLAPRQRAAAAYNHG
jgi:hypothetical protein